MVEEFSLGRCWVQEVAIDLEGVCQEVKELRRVLTMALDVCQELFSEVEVVFVVDLSEFEAEVDLCPRD